MAHAEMTVPAILRAMAARVRQGWCQHRLQTPGGERVCAIGAYGAALHGNALLTPERFGGLRVVEVLAQQICADVNACPSRWIAGFGTRQVAEEMWATTLPGYRAWEHVVDWNNAPGQTAENVAAAMELAAVCEEQRAAGGDPTPGAGSEEPPVARQPAGWALV